MSQNSLKLSLFLLRVSVFVVFLMWTLDKLIRPEHAGVVFKSFYFLPDLSPIVFTVIGILQLILIFAFLFGIQKKITYGLVLLFHFISTISTYKQYLAPYSEINLLFFAAWPMLAACVALYLLRDEDTMLTVRK